jgi:hypothetical protein
VVQLNRLIERLCYLETQLGPVDLDALSAFYARAFGAQAGQRYVNASKRRARSGGQSDRDHCVNRLIG